MNRAVPTHEFSKNMFVRSGLGITLENKTSFGSCTGISPAGATDYYYLPLQKSGVHYVDGQKRIVYRADGGAIKINCRFLRQWWRTIVDDCLHQRFLVRRRHGGEMLCKLIDSNSGGWNVLDVPRLIQAVGNGVNV